MNITFRRPQVEAQEAVRAMWMKAHKEGVDEYRNALVSLPTGCGKTIAASKHVFDAYKKGSRVLWIAHRRRLLDQAKRAFLDVWDVDEEKVGFVQASDNDIDAQVCFAMIDTLRVPARLEAYLKVGPPDVVVYDEAHHAVAKGALTVLNRIKEVRTSVKGKPPFMLGLTATVERADGKELGSYWTKAYSCSLLDALDPPEEWDEEPYLVPFVPKLERLAGLVLPKPKGNDYDDEELGHALLLAGVVQHTVKVLEKHAIGRRPMVYCATVEQARETAKGLQAAGWSADCIFGTTSEDERDKKIREFEESPIAKKPCLVNVAVLTEGSDIPPCDCIVFCRPTKSKGLYIQVLGRGLRLFPGKRDCIIIDIAGASEEHDLISAPILLKDMAKEKKARESRESTQSRPDSLNGMTKARRRVVIDWIEIPGLDRRVFAVNAGDQGVVALIQDPALKHADLWDPVWIAKGEATTKDGKSKTVRVVDHLSKRAVDIGMATSLGTDIARRALRLTGSNAKKSWVDESMTDAQRERLYRMYIHHLEDLPDLRGMTKGQAQELLDKDLIGRLLEAKGLAKIRRHAA